MHVAQNSQLLLKTLEIAIYFPRKIYKYDQTGFWVDSTGKFSSWAGQITLRRLARFFSYLNHRQTNYVTSGQKRVQNVARLVLRSRRRKVSSRRVYFSFLELTV